MQDDLVIRLAGPPREGITRAGPIPRPRGVMAGFKSSAAAQYDHNSQEPEGASCPHSGHIAAARFK